MKHRFIIALAAFLIGGVAVAKAQDDGVSGGKPPEQPQAFPENMDDIATEAFRNLFKKYPDLLDFLKSGIKQKNQEDI